MTYPQWITLPNLGTKAELTDLSLSPIILTFTNANSVSLLNGQLPPGINWAKVGYTVVLTGTIANLSQDSDYEWTFRITDGTYKVDRTFYLKVTYVNTIPIWQTSNGLLIQYYNHWAFANEGQTFLFKVVATDPEHGPVTYSLVGGSLPPGTLLNASNGVISGVAPLVGSDTTYVFTVRATDIKGGFADRSFGILVVDLPHAPIWNVDSGSFGTFGENIPVVLALDATSPMGLPLTYNIVSASPSFPGSLTFLSGGIIVGLTPTVTSDTVYTFQFEATDGTFSTNSGFFTLSVLNNATATVITWQTQGGLLGTIQEGQSSVFSVIATTSSNNNMLYSIIGGVLPPNLIVLTETGLLGGFVDYVPETKTFWFDILATDGLSTSIETFGITVEKKYTEYWNTFTLPIFGYPRIDLQQANDSTLIADNDIYYLNAANWGRIKLPRILIDNGVAYHNFNQCVGLLTENFKKFSLLITDYSLANGPNDDWSMIYRNLLDPQDKSLRSVDYNYPPPATVYPSSIRNLRREISQKMHYANGGNGTGASLSIQIDSNGTITGATVSNSGSGYSLAPSVQIFDPSQQGSGASFRSKLSCVSASITQGGVGYSIGDILFVQGGTWETQIIIAVLLVDPMTGAITAIEISDPGVYSLTPDIAVTTQGGQGAGARITLSFGVSSVSVVSGGANYSSFSTASFQGASDLPLWQQKITNNSIVDWKPCLQIAYVNPSAANSIVASKNQQTWAVQGQKIEFDHYLVSLEGLKILGYTTFDNTLEEFDGGQTDFWETENPIETLLDTGQLTLDEAKTTFNEVTDLGLVLALRYGKTTFDLLDTYFDLYAQIYDQNSQIDFSITKIEKLIKFDD